MLFAPASCPRIVVKVGSTLLVDPDGGVRREFVAELATALATRAAAGQRALVVSSGAIALGARRLRLSNGGRASLEDAQAAAAVGQIALAGLWRDAFAGAGLEAAQILLTADDLEHRRRWLNAAATLDRLLGWGVMPVVNENDSVATAEIRFGDNDRLAARIGQAARADGIVLLSDVDGLYDRDPANPEARHLPHVAAIDTQVEAMAGGVTSGMGTGGMRAKLAAARIAAQAGIPLAIASGRVADPLGAKRRHTLFAATSGRSARAAWLAGGVGERGVIRVDAGAARALAGGASLLAAGAVALEGRFARGDTVRIDGPDGPIARGLAEYDAADAARLLGRRSDEQAAILGYAPRAALVHRNHMALL